jgi:hypothetical protein
MSTINVDIVAPQSGTSVTVSGVEIDAPVATNIGIGTTALNSLTSGTNNVAIGEGALTTTTSTNRVVAIGGGALENSASSSNSVAIGYRAMRAGGGTSNIAIGYQTLFSGTGTSNVAVGKDALLSSTLASSNTALGTEAGKAVTTGGGNVFVGNYCGAALTTGGNNVFIGQGAGSFNSGDIFTGSNNIAIGGFGAGGGSDPSSLTVDNEITLGNSSHTVLRCNVTSITSLSDARDKKEISELSAGLDFVKTLKPVEFVWNDRDNEAKRDIKDFGFIAQDLKKSQEDAELADTLKLVYEENPEKLEASYGKLIPILVKAIQDLSAKVEALEAK